MDLCLAEARCLLCLNLTWTRSKGWSIAGGRLLWAGQGPGEDWTRTGRGARHGECKGVRGRKREMLMFGRYERKHVEDLFVRVGFWQNGFFADFYFWAAKFYRGFCREIFSPFCGKIAQKDPPGKSPAKSSKIYASKIPDTFLQRGQDKTCRITYFCVFVVFFCIWVLEGYLGVHFAVYGGVRRCSPYWECMIATRGMCSLTMGTPGAHVKLTLMVLHCTFAVRCKALGLSWSSARSPYSFSQRQGYWRDGSCQSDGQARSG